MKTIELSDTQVNPFPEYTRNKSIYSLAERCGISYEDRAEWAGRALSGNLHIAHTGFLDYLAKAWGNHHGIVIRPDDIWFMILCELTAVIAKKPGDYAKLFTTTPGTEQWIIVPTDDVTKIDVQLVIDRLKDCIPTDVDVFLPQFTTTTPDVRLACHVAFCDMVSPYYEYGTLLCGFPALRLNGTQEDWDKLVTALHHLSSIVFSGPVGLYLGRCAKCVTAMVQAVVDGKVSVLNQMVSLKKCGSGSQYEMSGWIFDLLFNTKQRTQLEGLPPHLATMKYTNLDTGRKFKLFTGLTESQFDGKFLIPRYGQYVVEVLDKPKKQLDAAGRTVFVVHSPGKLPKVIGLNS